MHAIRPPRRLGWLPSYPDFRDFTVDHNQVPARLKALGRQDTVKGLRGKLKLDREPAAARLPERVDLRPWCPPVEDQGELGSCTAHAGVGLVEYFERRAFGRHLDASRLFLYKTTRNLLKWTGDTGAFLRHTMAALVLFGTPPEEYWPYRKEAFDEEPPAFCYAFAQNYQALSYYRLDRPRLAPERLLTQIKINLAGGLPVIFGFTVFSSMARAEQSGRIPFPGSGERVEGGHAVLAAGYDDGLAIDNGPPADQPTRGALLIRNSWGEAWGEGGYGWLPYDYVLRGLAEDFWSLLKSEWVDTGNFGL